MPRTAVRSHAAVIALALVAVTGCASPAPVAEAPEPSAPSVAPSSSPAATPTAADRATTRELRELEAEFEARVGVSAVDTETGATVEFRADERFRFASTLKAFAAAELLRTAAPDERETTVTWTQSDVDRAGYSPVTSEHISTGLSFMELAEAAVRDSDNAAMNLILERLGGPSALGEGLAALGDTTTRVVDDEPDLNDVDAGSTDNTTTPAAFAENLLALSDPENLAGDDYDTLIDWMSGNATGDALVRAGAPAGWTVADKSGGAGPMRNDVAIVFPPDRAPIVITVLTERTDPTAEYDDALVARAAEIVLSQFE
ncbi:class A beta-lactamase [Demequina muriae]|uniref:Beta-lactamase n=1 Tax=Demequina muriae TaxID=3051664 RepID=A0ABT8GIQ6_9MICO|nr:class A beta-lactamase [Demequina sp. EGI L300058]MDN4481297.1 class A beta-lactamase [Demequina sp. EGI L300058]